MPYKEYWEIEEGYKEITTLRYATFEEAKRLLGMKLPLDATEIVANLEGITLREDKATRPWEGYA